MLPIFERWHTHAAEVRLVRHGANVGAIASEAKRLGRFCRLRRSVAARNDHAVHSPTIPSALFVLDYFGIALFATSGALVAAERRLDFVTFVFFAVVTGVGGGTLRDLLIGAPVFWVHSNGTLVICIIAASLVWVGSHHRFAGGALLWFDAAGLAAYSAYGAAKAMGFGVAPVPAFLMGVLTACAGGIVRDVLAREPSILLRHEIYITAAALASGLFVGLSLLGMSVWMAAAIAFAAGFALRAMAITRGWSLPAYKA